MHLRLRYHSVQLRMNNRSERCNINASVPMENWQMNTFIRTCSHAAAVLSSVQVLHRGPDGVI